MLWLSRLVRDQTAASAGVGVGLRVDGNTYAGENAFWFNNLKIVKINEL
jgi:hypothetical protein